MRVQRFRPLVMLLAVLATVLLVASDADARIGGGRSSGSRGSNTFNTAPATRTAPNTAAPFERTITQPGQPGFGRPAIPARQPGGFFNRPGLLGGLAAGFLGAGLLGLLFGHGLFGGLGGLASLFGLLLQVGLILIVGRLLWNWWQRRQQPALAAYGSGPAMRDADPGANPGGFGGLGRSGFGGSSGGASTQPLNLEPGDFDTFERLLEETQAAYSREDLSALKRLSTPEMVSYFADDLTANASRGVVNQISNVKLLQGDLSEAWREGDADYATVAMRFSLVDKMVDRTGRMVEGSDQPQEATELWTFRRNAGGSWLVSAIQQT